MLKKCLIAVLLSVVIAHNAYAIIDPVLLMGNVAQYLEQFKEGVNTLEAMYRRMEELGILEMVDDVEKVGDNLGKAYHDVISVGKSLDPGKIGGSFMGKVDSLPTIPKQLYKPTGKTALLDAAKQGFAGKDKIRDWVKKEIYSGKRKEDSDQPTDEEVMEEKRLLLNSMRNATGIDAYAYGVMVETRLDAMPANEETSAVDAVSNAKTEADKLKAVQALQSRIAQRLNEINKLQAKLTEITAINAMHPDVSEDEKDDQKPKENG